MPSPWACVVAVLTFALALGAAGCNKGPAAEALVAAEQALETAQPDLERYAPEKHAALSAAREEARLALDEGRYTESLRAAQELPARIRLVAAKATSRRAAMVADWEELAGAVPAALARLRTRVHRLAVAASPGAEGWVEGVRADLRALDRDWSEAAAAFDEGSLSRAVKAGRDVSARAQALAEKLGRPSASAAPAPSRPAAETTER